MAISIIAGSIAANDSTTIPVPTGTRAGDTLVLWFFTGYGATGGTVPTAPAGWATVASAAFNGTASSIGIGVATKVAGPAEASVVFTAGSGTTPFSDGSMIALRSSLVVPLAVHAASTAGAAGADTSSVTLPTLQILQPGELGFILTNSANNQAPTLPAGYTVLASATDLTNGGQTVASIAWGSGPTATGAQTYTVTTADLEGAAHILIRELSPAFLTVTPPDFFYPVVPRAVPRIFPMVTTPGYTFPTAVGAPAGTAATGAVGAETGGLAEASPVQSNAVGAETGGLAGQPAITGAVGADTGGLAGQQSAAVGGETGGLAGQPAITGAVGADTGGLGQVVGSAVGGATGGLAGQPAITGSVGAEAGGLAGQQTSALGGTSGGLAGQQTNVLGGIAGGLAGGVSALGSVGAASGGLAGQPAALRSPGSVTLADMALGSVLLNDMLAQGAVTLSDALALGSVTLGDALALGTVILSDTALGSVTLADIVGEVAGA